MAATPEETLADEGRRRTRAGAVAIAAGALTLVGALLVLAANRDFPSVALLDALRARFGPEPAPGTGVLARKVLYYDDHIAQILAVQLVPVVALALVGVALIYLYLSTRARNPGLSKVPLIAAVAGAVLVVVPAVVASVSLTLDVGAFASSARQTEAAARDVLDSPVGGAAYSLVMLGTFVLGLAFVLTSLYAMRVGLLTRFMGVLGIIVGVLFIVPLESRLPLVKVFWLLGLGALFLGRWPGGPPPAWVTGEAQPWPTQQEIREARMERQAEQGATGLERSERRPRRGRPEPPETPAPVAPSAKPHSSSKKKKRKRR